MCWLGQDPHFIFKDFCSFVVVASLTFIQIECEAQMLKHVATHLWHLVAKHLGNTQSPTGHPGTRALCRLCMTYLQLWAIRGHLRPPTQPTSSGRPASEMAPKTFADSSLHSGLTARNHELNIQWQDWKVDVKVGPTPEPSPAQLTLRMVSGFRDLKQVCGFTT